MRRATPALGLITKTAAWSSCVQRILLLETQSCGLVQAHVAHDRIVIYKVLASGELQAVETRQDFRTAKILAAEVLPFSLHTSPLVKHEDPIIQTVPVAPSRTADHRLIVILDDGLLLHFRCTKRSSGVVSLDLVHSLPLPRHTDTLSQYGKLLAVAPSGRAIAAAAPQGSLMVFSVSTDGQISAPVFVESPDYTLHALFMKSASWNDEQQLLLVKVVGRRLYFQILDWPAASAPPNINIHVRQKLDLEDGFVEALTSLSTDAVLLASNKGLFLFTNLLSGSPARTLVELPLDNFIKDPYHADAVWTACVRQHSRVPYTDVNDTHCLLMRSNGTVLMVHHTQDRSAPPRCAVTLASTISIRVDSAVSFHEHLGGRCLLTVRGDRNEGGVFVLDDDGDFTLFQRLPSYGPALDLITSSLARARNVSNRTSDGLFSTGGTSQDGRIIEMRPGKAAQLLFTFDLEGAHGMRGLWPVALPNIDAALFVTTMKHSDGKEKTQIAALDDTGITLIDAASVQASTLIDVSMLQLGEATIYMEPLSESLNVVQVTTQTARLITPSESRELVRIPSSARIVKACVNPSISLLAVAVRHANQQVAIRFAHLDQSPAPGDEHSLVGGEVTAMELLQTGHGFALAVATNDGVLRLLWQAASDSIPHTFRDMAGNPVVCDSIGQIPANRPDCNSAMINPNQGDDGPEAVLVCGLRNGHLQVLNARCESLASFTLGVSSISLMPLGNTVYQGISSAVFVAACGSSLFMVSRRVSSESQMISVEPLYLVDTQQPSLQHAEIQAAVEVKIDMMYMGMNLRGSLAIAMGESIYVATINDLVSPHPVAHSLMTIGKPLRQFWSSQLRCFVVGCIEESSPGHNLASRSFRSTVEFRLPMDNEQSNTSYDTAGTTRFLLQASERVYGMEEWVYDSSDGRRYVFVLVATSLEGREDTAAGGRRRSKGRVHVLQPSVKNGRVVSVKLATSTKFDEPVYAICRYGNSAYICGHGPNLSMYEFDPGQHKWQRALTAAVSSPPVHLSVVDDYLFVTTARDSIMKYYISTSPESPSPQRYLFRLVSDTVSAPGQHHLSLPKDVHLLSTKAGRVRVLYDPSKSRTTVQPSKSFECIAVADIGTPLTRMVATNVSQDPLQKQMCVMGSGIDGSLFGLAMLPTHDWAVLKWVELLCRRSSIICPFDLQHRGNSATAAVNGGIGGASLLPMGFAGLRKYNGESDFSFEARTGLQWITVREELWRETDAVTTAADDVDDMEDVLFDEQQQQQHAPTSRTDEQDDGWERPLSLLRIAGWAEADMHVDGDVLGRLLKAESTDGDAASLLRALLDGERSSDDRPGSFVREHFTVEHGLIEQTIELLDKRLKGWGYW